MKLALNWNRVDIARDYIFTEEIKWKSRELDDVMFDAILNDRVDFVRLLLENSFNLKKFLTYRRLIKLYNEVSKSNLSLLQID